MHKHTRANFRSLFLVACLLLLCTLILAGCAGNGAIPDSQSFGQVSANVSNSTTVNQLSPGVTKPTVPFTLMRMLDGQHGWALSATSILKTADGGQTWRDVTPSTIHTIPQPTAVFYNSQTAWVGITSPGGNGTAVKLIHTINGGASWTTQTARINTPAAGIIDIKFINSHEGWVEVSEGVGAGQEGAGIVHTIDGGANWKLVSTSINPSHGVGFFPYRGLKTGLSFVNSLTGWATVITYATNQTYVYITHNGGVSWMQQSLPPPSTSKSVMGGSTPPVFFGREGVLPALENNGFIFYLSHNGGLTWITTTLVLPKNQTTHVDQNSIYVTDPLHGWAIDSQGLLYITSNGGRTWHTPLTLHNVSKFSFISNTIGWAYSGQSQSTPTLLKTTNGGRTWSKINYSIH